MAILNLNETDFIIYASGDTSYVVITINFDEEFITNILKKVKYNYYTKMLHYICLNENRQ